MDTPPNKPRVIGRPFTPGHAKMGGRGKGVRNKRTENARELATRLGADPLQFLLEVITRDAVRVVLIDRETGKVRLGEDGEPLFEWQAVPIEMRLDAAKAAAPYVHAKLLSATVNADDERDDSKTIDIGRMMEDPALVEAAQTLSLAANHAPMLPAPEIPLESLADSDEDPEDD